MGHSALPDDSSDDNFLIIPGAEQFWVDHQPFLLSRGYKLRSRYDPNWIPSWVTKRAKGEPYNISRLEDSLCNPKIHVIDAIRTHDNVRVAIKRVRTWIEELPIALHLSSEAMLSDPRNRSVPVLDVLLLPDDDMHALLIMPMLVNFYHLPFRRVGEFAEALDQYLQGLEFMHARNIAHRDACRNNLMMDASKMIPKGLHFAHHRSHDGVSRKISWRTRSSVAPVKYFFIDFDLSSRYPSGMKNILDYGILGQDRTVPEQSLTVPYDPFKYDVYQLGNCILGVIAEYEGLEMFRPLCEAMTRHDPQDRPTALEALHQFQSIISSLKKSDLRRRVWLPKVPEFQRFLIKYFGSNYI